MFTLKWCLFFFLLLLLCSFQNTKHYELLNYSEHGTTVDNVLYSCDFSEKASPTPPSGLVAKVQGIIRESKIIHIVCPCGQSDWERVCHDLSRIYLHIYYIYIHFSFNSVQTMSVINATHGPFLWMWFPFNLKGKSNTVCQRWQSCPVLLEISCDQSFSCWLNFRL